MAPTDRFRKPLTLLLVSLFLLACSASGSSHALTAANESKGMEDAAEHLVYEALRERVRTVVIDDLVDAGDRRNDLGRYFADELAAAMLEVNRDLSICDRDAVKPILREHAFQRSGMVAPEARARLGDLCGPDALVVGQIVQEEGRLRVLVRLVTLNESNLLAAAGWSLPAKPHHLSMLHTAVGPDDSTSDTAADLQERLAVDEVLPPERRRSTTRYMDLGLKSTSGPFGFELRHCVFKPSNYLKCMILVRNKMPVPRTFTLRSSGTSLLDTASNDYSVDLVTLRGQDFTDTRPGQTFADDIPPDTQVQLELIFTGVPRVKKKGQTLILVLDDLDPVYFRDFFFARE